MTRAIKDIARFGSIAALTALLVAVPFGAGAAVRKEGSWPAADAEKKVSFEFEGKPSAGLKKLAHEAGWSLVLSKGVAEGEADVHIDVDDQPADAVLDALFAQANVVAKRNGTLVTIVKDEGTPPPAGADAVTSPPETPAPPAALVAPPMPTVRGEDREALGGKLTVEANEVVHTVTVTGGSADVRGTVTGDIVLVGGKAVVSKGARVIGNVQTMGGKLVLEDGARIDGDVEMVGGKLERAPGASIGGKVSGSGFGHDDDVKVNVDLGDHDALAKSGSLAEAGHAIAARVSKLSLLFVLGCVLLALMGGRMDRLRVEVAARPMKAFALGILATMAACVTALVLCITIIGIPIVVVGVLVGILASYGAVAAILTTVGAALAGHRTSNVYVHLLLGCAILFVLGAIPYVGGLVSFVLAMTSIGVLVTTRGGGLLDKRARPLV
jgi:hypothetical protein